MTQYSFSVPGPVLDEHGHPNPGYSTSSLLTYNRHGIKAPPWRIKEWDFYQASDKDKCIQFTIGHASYAGQVNVMLFDFRKGKMIAEKGRLLPLIFNRLHMPSNADHDGTLAYHSKVIDLSFVTQGNKRIISCRADNFAADLTFIRENPHALVINVPFTENPKAFYYNHKINCMRAQGTVTVDGCEYIFDPADSFGLLDWGRGVWPFHNEWYWSNGTGEVDGQLFGFNLGTGFGDTSKATENALFYKKEFHKLGRVNFHLGKDYMQPWVLQDEEGRLDLTLTPVYDRTTKTKLLFIDNCTHQMFGEMNGKVVLDNGKELIIKDLTAFAEHAVNNW